MGNGIVYTMVGNLKLGMPDLFIILFAHGVVRRRAGP